MEIKDKLLKEIEAGFQTFLEQVSEAKENILRRAYRCKYGRDVEEDDEDVHLECLVSNEGKEMFVRGNEVFCIMDQPQINGDGEVYIPCCFPENMKIDLDKIKK